MATATESTTGAMHREVTLTRVFDAPRPMVWKAWTDPVQMAKWWGPHGYTNPVCEMDVRPGGALLIVMRAPDGTEYPMPGTFNEVVEPERLVFTSYAEDSDGNRLLEAKATVTFEDEGGHTKLTVHSVGNGLVPVAEQMLAGMEAGWSQSIERLEEVTRTIQGPIVVERVYQAPVDLVWKALTNRDDLVQWFFELPEFRAEVGFQFGFIAEHEGVVYPHQCEIKEVIPGKKIAYSWHYEDQPGDSLVSITLAPEGSGTLVKLTHEGLETFPNTKDYARSNYVGGWEYFIGSALKDFVEKV